MIKLSISKAGCCDWWNRLRQVTDLLQQLRVLTGSYVQVFARLQALERLFDLHATHPI